MYEWQHMFSEVSLENGKQLYERNKVRLEKEKKGTFLARMAERKTIHVRISESSKTKSYKVKCDCAIAVGGQKCKHMAAALYALEAYEAPLSEWNPAELERYEYFDREQILYSMSPSVRMQNEAKKLIEKGKVSIERVQTGYYPNEKEIFGKCTAIGRDGKEQFFIQIIFRKSEVTQTMCQCRECQKNYYYHYYYSRVNNKCVYTVASLFLLKDYLKEKNIGDATDAFGMRVLHSFKKEERVALPEHRECVLLDVFPRLINKGGRLRAGFKISGKKSFVIKDLVKFCSDVRASADVLYGSSTVYHHAIENFTKNAQKWIAYIEKAVKEEAALEKAIEERGGYAGGEEERRQWIDLYGSRMDEFFDLSVGEEVEYEKRDSYKKVKKKLSFIDKEPSIVLTIRKHEQSTHWKFHGITVSYDMPHFFEGLKTGYYIENDKLCRVRETFFQKVAILADLSIENDTNTFQIGRNHLTEFYHYVLPQLQEEVEIIEEDSEEIAKYIPPRVLFCFGLDAEQGNISCRVTAKYGTKEYVITAEQQEEDQEPFRDRRQEKMVSEQVVAFFPQWDDKNMEFHCGKQEQYIYEVLQTGLDVLYSMGEVKCTERFRRLQSQSGKKLKWKVGVSLASGLLDLSVSADDISQEEVTDILQSYRARKKYHRLKNGIFLSLEDADIGALDEIVETLRLTPKDLKNKQIPIPIYRMLYLDKLLEEKEEWYVSRDAYFCKAVEGFKNVSEAEYEVPDSLHDIMRNYQKVGYKWLRTLESMQFGGILADDMGLGKTLQVIAVLLSEKAAGRRNPSLIVTPASLVYNWEEEIRQFAPQLHTAVIAGTQEERMEKLEEYRQYDVLLTSYDLLKRDIAFYEGKQFFYHIIDEAQYIKNHTTAAAKAVKVIESKVRYALTGTPIENRLSELWSIFDFLMPGYLYGYETFRTDFEIPIIKYEEKEPMERLRRMTAPFILRRLKEQVLKELPDKLEENYYMQLNGEQQKLYHAQVLKMKQQIAMQDADTFRQNKIQILAELMKIRQICCDPSLCYENYQGGSAKLETCMELVHSAVDGGHRILLFSQFTSMLENIEKRLSEEQIQYYKITGGVGKEQRMQLVKQFNKGDVPIFLISLKAGGVGLNLTGADVVIHYDPWWNLAVQNQATDRAHRIGQTKKVVVYKLIAKNTIEEKIQQLQERKKLLSDQIIQNDVNMFSTMTKEDFLSMLEI